MKTELVISASSDRADIALLEDGRLQELIKEKGDDSFSVGDVYLGTVKKLATGLNAAFVDVGYEKDAFLHYHDLGPQINSWQSYLRKTLKGKQQANISNFQTSPNIEKEGNIGDVLKQGDQILVQITNFWSNWNLFFTGKVTALTLISVGNNIIDIALLTCSIDPTYFFNISDNLQVGIRLVFVPYIANRFPLIRPVN